MKPRRERVTRLDYCQYLLVSQINYTLTNYADHTEKFSHDMANRYLAADAIRSLPSVCRTEGAGKPLSCPAARTGSAARSARAIKAR